MQLSLYKDVTIRLLHDSFLIITQVHRFNLKNKFCVEYFRELSIKKKKDLYPLLNHVEAV